MPDFPDNQTIEHAFRETTRVIDSLPANTESREAKRLVTIAEGLAHESREKAPSESGE